MPCCRAKRAWCKGLSPWRLPHQCSAPSLPGLPRPSTPSGWTGALAGLKQAPLDYDQCKAKGFVRVKKGRRRHA